MNRVLILFFVFFVNLVHAQWTQVFTNNTTNDIIQSLQATTDGGVIAVRDADYIKSNDYGANWTIYPSSSMGCGSAYLRSLSMYNKDTFCITSNVSTSLYLRNSTTLNNGSSFNCYSYTVLPNLYVRQTTKLNKNGTIFMAVDNGLLYRSNNFGSSFTVVEDINDLDYISFNSDSAGILINSDEIFHYNDASGVLTNLNSPVWGQVGWLSQAQLIGDSTIYIIGSESGNGVNLFKTTNLGQTWTEVFETNFSGNNGFDRIHFINQDTGFVYGNKIILRTLDGGLSWQVQRFNTFLLDKIFFTDVNNGFIGGRNNNVSFIYKTTTGGGPWADFNYFYMSNTACCANILCGINATFSTGNSYSWLLDGILSGTGLNPSFTMSSGNHTVSLISTDGVEVDTFTTTVYSAPPLPANTDILYYYNLPDTTICYGTQFIPILEDVDPNYNYSLWQGTNQQYGPVSTSNYHLYLYSDPLFNSTTFTIQLETDYPFCPGNSYSEDFQVIVYPNRADTDPFFVEDSVCLGDTAFFTIPNANSNYVYSVYSSGCNSYIENPIDWTNPLVHGIDVHWRDGCSDFYYYRVVDSDGCTNYSDEIKLFVDTAYAALYTSEMFGFIGDTVRFRGNSYGDAAIWEYDPSFLERVDSSWTSNGFKIIAPGKSKVNYIVTNSTGCFDSSYHYVNGFLDNSNSIDNFCMSAVTDDITSTLYGEMGCKNYQTYSKTLHVDRNGNSYLAGLTSVNINQSYQASSTITKIDSVGNIAWHKTFALNSPGLSHHNLFLNSVATDSYGNVYLTGRYNVRDFTIDGFNAPDPDVTNDMPGAAFIAKLSKQGIVQWLDFTNTDCSTNPTIVSGIRVMNDSTIIIGGNNLECVYNMPLNQNIWTTSNFFDDGFLILDQNGMVKKYIECQGLYEDMETSIDECYSNTALEIPSFIDFEIIDDRIYLLKLLRYNFGHSFGKGIVSIYDTTGNYIREFDAFRFSYSESPIGHPDYSYFSSISDDYWDHVGSNMSEPKLLVDSKTNIYVSFTPYASRNYALGTMQDTVYKSMWGLEIPAEGFIEGSFNSSLIAKYDTSGNLLYSIMNDGIILKDFCLSANRQINCIADYSRFYSLESTDGLFYGGEAEPNTFNGLYFVYDENGVLQSHHPIPSLNVNPGSFDITITAGITSPDTCNSNVYFAFATNTGAEYDGVNYMNPRNFYMMKVNNIGNCSDLTYCIPQVIVNSLEEDIAYENWILAPNPSNDKISLSYVGANKSQSNVSFIIYNSIGEIVTFERNVSSFPIDIDIRNYSNGIYYFCVFDEKGSYLDKLSFVKQ